jgi:hypothetical protein
MLSVTYYISIRHPHTFLYILGFPKVYAHMFHYYTCCSNLWRLNFGLFFCGHITNMELRLVVLLLLLKNYAFTDNNFNKFRHYYSSQRSNNTSVFWDNQKLLLKSANGRGGPQHPFRCVRTGCILLTDARPSNKYKYNKSDPKKNRRRQRLQVR